MFNCFSTKEDETLYIIVPYFNFIGFETRRQLFIQFISEIQFKKGIKILVVEMDGPAPLPSLKVWKHVHAPMTNYIWVKENLINFGSKFIPETWKYLSWVDADISFLNSNWVEDTITCLQFYDLVQLFQSGINLGPNGQCVKVDKGFGYMHSASGTQFTKTDKYGYWHPGYGWACTRKWWLTVGGLIDWAILGSADRHMAMAMIGLVDISAPITIHTNYKKLLDEFQIRCEDLKLGYVQGTIVHHWHGSLENRKYKERWKILTDNKFDPKTDIQVNEHGLIEYTESGKRIENEIEKYFIDRKEDS
jgi:hypothetical protein